MGRFVGKPLLVPTGIEIRIEDRTVIAKGNQGENRFKVPVGVNIQFDNNQLVFTKEDKEVDPALVGLSFRKVQNIIIGVNEKFTKNLEINGVGYRWNISGQKLQMQLGFSHDIVYEVPDSIEVTIKENKLTVAGIDKQKVGEVAADIKKYRPIEPYKGKGIKYTGQYVVRKQGKAGSSK